MPVYDYRCEKCGHGFEKLVFHGDEEARCPRCEGQGFKLMSTFSIDIPDETCAHLPKGEAREYCTECKSGGGSCPLSA